MHSLGTNRCVFGENSLQIQPNDEQRTLENDHILK